MAKVELSVLMVVGLARFYGPSPQGNQQRLLNGSKVHCHFFHRLSIGIFRYSAQQSMVLYRTLLLVRSVDKPIDPAGVLAWQCYSVYGVLLQSQPQLDRGIPQVRQLRRHPLLAPTLVSLSNHNDFSSSFSYSYLKPHDFFFFSLQWATSLQSLPFVEQIHQLNLLAK